MTPRLRDNLATAVLVIFFTAFGFATMGQYAVRKDASTRLVGGVANYYYLAYGDKVALDPQYTAAVAKRLDLLEDHPFMREASPRRPDDSPLFDALGFVACRKLHISWHWLNLYDAHNAVAVFVFAILVALVYRFTASAFDPWAGGVAALALGFLPALVEPSHNDPGWMWLLFFSFLTVTSFFALPGGKRPVPAFLSPVFFGLAVASDPSAAYLLLFLIPWYVLQRVIKPEKISMVEIVAGALFIPGAFLTWEAMFPFLWTAPSFNEIMARHMQTRAFEFFFGSASEGDISFRILFQALTRTPLHYFIFLFVGIYEIVNRFLKEKDTRGMLFVFWLVVSWIWMILPQLGGRAEPSFDFYPALAVIFGIGAMRIWNWIEPFLKKPPLKIAAASACCVVLVLFLPRTVLVSHPFEGLYFNILTGGFEGARERFSSAIDLQRSSARYVAHWLNMNAREKADVVFLGYPDYDRILPSYLRAGLKKTGFNPVKSYLGVNLGDEERVQGDMDIYTYIGYVVVLNEGKPKEDPAWLYLQKMEKKPLHSVKVEGVEIARIFLMEDRFALLDRGDRILVVFLSKKDMAEGHMYIDKKPKEHH